MILMVHPKETTKWPVCDFIGVGLVKFEIVKKIKAKSAEHREHTGTIQQKFHDSRLTGWRSLWQARGQTTCPVAVVTIKLGPSIVNGAVIAQNLCTIDNSFQFIILYLLFNSHVACRDTKSRARAKYNFVSAQINRFYVKMILRRTYNEHCVGIRKFANGPFVLWLNRNDRECMSFRP